MPATCSNNINPPEGDPLPHPTRCHCSRGEQCDCGNGRFLSLLTSSPSFGRSYQEDSKQMSHVSNKEHSDHLLYQSDCTSARNYASLGLIIQRNSHDPLSVATIRTITSCINPPNLNSVHTYKQNEFSSGTRTTLVLGSAPLRQFSLFQSLFRLPNTLLRSLWLAILPSYASVDTKFRLGQASASSDENALQNEVSQIDLWRHLLIEWSLHMHRPADSLLEESTSFFVVSANHGVHNFRLMAELHEQNAGVTYQQPLHFSIGMRNNRYGSMWLDVDNMSYEELLDLEDHIGYVSTGLSEEAACASIKRSNYFLFAEDNAQKDFCTICQEDFAEEDELGTLDCGHGFHILCIKQWLGYKNACPICKSPGLDTTRPSFSLFQSP